MRGKGADIEWISGKKKEKKREKREEKERRIKNIRREETSVRFFISARKMGEIKP